MKIARVINWLERSSVRDFMFILDMNEIDQGLRQELLLKGNTHQM